MEYKIQNIELSKLALNTGQIEGLPANPRQWTREDIDKIAASLTETPELFEMRPCIVTPHEGKFVILAGSLRFSGARANGVQSVPCIVFEGDVDKMKQIVIKDNGSFGAWDFDSLANEWDELPLSDWGVPAWNKTEVEEDEPEDLDADPIEKPFILKITFPNAEKMSEFVMAYKNTLENDYECTISESGGGL